jgi:hypothetical protein
LGRAFARTLVKQTSNAFVFRPYAILAGKTHKITFIEAWLHILTTKADGIRSVSIAMTTTTLVTMQPPLGDTFGVDVGGDLVKPGANFGVA